MNFLSAYFTGPTTEALGWTIVHSLWQGMAIGLIALLILKFRQKATAQFRYLVGVTSLITILVCSVVTFNISLQTEAGVVIGQPTLKDGMYGTIGLSSGEYMYPGGMDQIPHILSNAFPWMTTIWLFGVLILSLRLVGGLFHVNQIRNQEVFPLPEYWKDKFMKLARNSGINRSLRFLLSDRIAVPTVIGVFKPVILVPAGIISLMPVEQLESIIAHEIAHIRRYDYLINIIQSLIEALFFYHPVVWLLSSNIRQERENCCDDYAVKVCGKLSIYAKALAGLGEFQVNTAIPAVALSGNKNRIVHRVERLINPRKMKTNVSEKIAAGLIIIGSAIIMTLSTGASPTVKFDLKALEKNQELLPAEVAQEAEEAIPEIPSKPEFAGIPSESEITGIPSAPDISSFPSEPSFYSVPLPDAMPAFPEIVSFPDTNGWPEHSHMDIKDNVVTREFITKDGSEKTMKFHIREGEVTKLYVDGEEIPASEHSNYQKEIDRTMKDLQEMDEDLREAREELENIDWEQIQFDIQQEMEHLHQHDMVEMQEEMKRLQEEHINIEIDHEHMQQEIQKAMQEMKINKQEMQKEMQKAMQEAQKAMQDNKEGKHALSDAEIKEMEEEIARAMKKIEEFDTQEMMKRMEKEMQALQHINHEEIQHQIQEAMKELENINFEEIEHRIQESLKHMEKKEFNIQKELKSMDELIEELEKLELKED